MAQYRSQYNGKQCVTFYRTTIKHTYRVEAVVDVGVLSESTVEGGARAGGVVVSVPAVLPGRKCNKLEENVSDKA